jgi:hypothetical protein
MGVHRSDADDVRRHDLAPDRVGCTDDCGVLDGGMLAECIFHFTRIDVEAPSDDELAGAAHEVHIAVCIEVADVTRTEPAVGGEGSSGRLGSSTPGRGSPTEPGRRSPRYGLDVSLTVSVMPYSSSTSTPLALRMSCHNVGSNGAEPLTASLSRASSLILGEAARRANIVGTPKNIVASWSPIASKTWSTSNDGSMIAVAENGALRPAGYARGVGETFVLLTTVMWPMARLKSPSLRRRSWLASARADVCGALGAPG